MADETKKCIFCAEDIKVEAKICRFCNKEQVDPKATLKPVIAMQAVKRVVTCQAPQEIGGVAAA